MKTFKQKFIALTLAAVLLTGLITGCGRGGNDNAIDPDTIAFLATYLDIELGNSHVQTMVSHGDYIYFYTSEWLEAEMRNVNKLLKISAAGDVEEVTLFPLGDNEYISNMTVNPQGNFILLAMEWAEDGASYTIYEVSPDGRKINETDLGEKLELGQESYIQQMASDDSDNIYLMVSTFSTNTTSVICLGSDGEIKGRIEHSGWMSSLICAKGDVFASVWGDNGMVLRKADFAAGSFGSEIQLAGISRNGNMSFTQGGETGVLVSDGTSLFAADLENSTTTKILDWIDSDINANNISGFGQLENGLYWLFSQMWGQEKTISELVVLKQTTFGELPQRENIIYGALTLSHDVRTAIINFNKTSDKYRIIPKEYFTFTADDDWKEAREAAVHQFYTDITTGRGPDIIDLHDINFSLLATKGVLYDLTSLIEKSDINLDDYLENALNAYNYNGKKYGMMTGFMVDALVGHKSRLDGIDNWNISEMIEWAEKYPGSQLMNTTSAMVMNTMVSSVLDKFVDWSTGKCDFTGDEFIRIMEFAATFGDDMEDWRSPDRVGTHEGLTTGKYLLMGQRVNDINYMQLLEAMFDMEPKFMGYPTDDGGRIMLSPTGAAGINAKSRNKDGAFEFISYLMSDRFQNAEDSGHRFAIPIKKSALDEMIRTSTVTAPGRENHTMTWGVDDLMVEILQSRNAEFIDQFLDLIARAEGIRSSDEQINNIIEEEAASFFAGQKSAREAAEIIQSRVQVYVNENR
ncbi:MAG: extracellular solute-binding protein [Lachnospiraceae bacterium]|nr:extracellular solute-binding protein [Lachnospiraceae bacterium]